MPKKLNITFPTHNYNVVILYVFGFIILYYMSLQEINHPKIILFRELIGQLLNNIKQEVKKSRV